MATEIKVIKSEQDYQTAVLRFSSLMDIDFSAGSKEEAEFELLSLVIQAYEKSIVPPVSVDPIEAIFFRMDQLGLARKDLAEYIGSVSKVSEVLSGKRPLSLAMIRRLHAGLGIPAEALIADADSRSDISSETTVDYAKFPLKEMLERKCIPGFESFVGKCNDYAEELVRAFTSSFSSDMSAAFLRAPMHQNSNRSLDEYALYAWRICVVRKARSVKLQKKYSEGIITSEWLSALAKLSRFEAGPTLAREYLADHGIVLVVEKHFKKTYLDGAAMLDGDVPVIALTLRHDRVDNFWFVLFHELMHLKLHLTPSNPLIVDNLDDKVFSAEKEEQEANEGARDALISRSVWDASRVKTSLKPSDAVALADQLRISPAIIAGRVRFETGDWRLMSGMLGKDTVAACFPDC